MFLMTLIFGSAVAWADANVNGTVTDQAGEPLIGVSVMVKGTSKGTMTDIDGNYSLAGVPTPSTLVFSYMGMVGQEFKIEGNQTLNVVMSEDALSLDDVVVIGYGSAKAKDLTAPIAVVQGSDLTDIPTSSPMAALTGKVPGVNILNSGQPGAGPKVQVRGIGSFSDSSPLYVVDGIFYDNINFLNNDDIKEMSILKDASAAAIYGVKAANGVVLITTKRGQRNQEAKITYNGYVGFQRATNKLKMASSNEYAQMLMEANPTAYKSYIDAAVEHYGGSYDAAAGIYNLAVNTDWYDELLREAVMTNHSLTISGGGEKSTYSLGLNYLYQNGIQKAENNYNRLNFRAQVEYEAKPWLKVGFNGIFSKSNQRMANNAAWIQAFTMPGLMPVYDSNNTTSTPVNYASPMTLGYTNNFYNPVATANYYNSRNENYQAMTNFYADFTFIPSKLTFRTSYGYDFSSIRGKTMTEPYYVSNVQQNTESLLVKESTDYNKWVWDNVLTYTDTYDKHNWGAMVGYSMRQDRYDWLQGQANGVPWQNTAWWYIAQGDGTTSKANDNGTRYRSQSVFARLNYSYDSRYLFMFTFRADGSSKYQEKWGYFPSVGGAWVISNEKFMEDQNWANYLKLRASWGMLGNDKVAASDGFASITQGNTASGVFGSYGDGYGVVVPGYQNSSYFSWLKWERVNETNVGLEYATLNNRLTADIDWFYRMTTDAVISPTIAFSNQTLAGNWGKILNTGFDISINWKDNVGDFKYYAGFNCSTLRNRVKELKGRPYIIGGKTVNIVGKPMNSFYGYEVIGVYQTPEEVAADPIAVANGLEPGDFKYKDLNEDGVIDGSDRKALGNYLPTFTYGINFGFEYRGWDFALSTYGQHGAKLFNRKRQNRYAQGNWNFDHDQFKNRWTGPGSTNEYPSAAALMKSWNVSSSATASNSYFVESADYFRIQNITLGYTFRNIKISSAKIASLRLSLSADRPFNFFSANSFTPELSDPEGWDTEVYPLSATYTFGVQLDF